MELIPGIHRLVGETGGRIVAFYLLRGERRSLLLDTAIQPMMDEVFFPYCGSTGFDPSDLDYVLISHSDLDHSGGNAAVRKAAPRAVFACHRADRPLIEDVDTLIEKRYRCYAWDDGIDESDDGIEFIRKNVFHTPLDLTLSGGETFDLGGGRELEVLHLPGHSRGHVGLYDRTSDTLLAQDAVLGKAVPFKDGSPAFPPTYRYYQPYLQTIARIEALAPARLLTCHYRVLEGAAVGDFLAESRAFAESLHGSLTDALRAADRPVTMKELCATLGEKLGDWAPESSTFLCWPLTGHLEELQSLGQCRKIRENDLSHYQWTA